ncbi:MAG: hypothetical protein ACRD2N_03205 [Vicinamibacterales bacterium]
MRDRSAVSRAAGILTGLALSASLTAQGAERVLYISIIDQKTREPISGLGPDAMIVKEDGIRREVLRVAPATSPMPVAILVDNSQGATDTIPDLRRALAMFVRELDGLGPIALVTVADRPTILQDYTSDQKRLLDAAARVFSVPESGATLLDAIVEVGNGLSRRESDRAAMVLVTTEHTEFSPRHYTEVLESLTKSGAMMSAIVFTNASRSLSSDEARNRAFVLDRGPKDSGGVRIDVLTSLAYEGRMRELAAILKRQYRVVYARPDSLIPPERVQIDASNPSFEAYGAPARGQRVR